MSLKYNIYLENESANTAEFWCFLAPPQGLKSINGVFVNSNTSLAVVRQSPAINRFQVSDPLTHVVGAGAGFVEPKEGATISPSIVEDAKSGNSFQVSYANIPPRMEPTLTPTRTSRERATIQLQINHYNKVQNEKQGWFGNLYFGVKTNQRGTGLSWSPNPGAKWVLTPRFKICVAVGQFQSNTLVPWADLRGRCADVTSESFSAENDATVTYTETGEWRVTPGAPERLRILLDTQMYLKQAQAHFESLVE